jgi:gas vesicle protein
MNKTLLVLLLGVGIGLLVAPDKGSVTLRRLKDRLGDLGDKAEDEADQLVGQGKKAYKAGKSKIEDAIN